MILKKIIISAFAMCFLTGCLQNKVFLGPALTIASTGNVYQAGLSYGSSQAIKKMTGKTPTENVKSFLDSKNTKVKKEEIHDEFFVLVKDKIEKIKKPKATTKNLNANAEKGSLLSIIGFVVTKAEDHKIIKMNG